MTDPHEQEYDFALIVGGVAELTQRVEDALYEAGCDDATVSMQYGLLYLDFSRTAESLQVAILSAIEGVRRADIGGETLRVDQSNLVSASDIARRTQRSRQQIHQYIMGQRGPGGFPPPECHLSDGKPLWAWCAVSQWLVGHAMLRPEESWNAEVVAAINTTLEQRRQHRRHPELVDSVRRQLETA